MSCADQLRTRGKDDERRRDGRKGAARTRGCRNIDRGRPPAVVEVLRPRAEDLISAISSIKHPIAGLTLTQSWVKQHAPEIVELRVEAENTPNGGELRHVRARVTGPDGEEDHARSIHFLPCHEQHGLFRSAEERAAESAAAESAAVADWAWRCTRSCARATSWPTWKRTRARAGERRSRCRAIGGGTAGSAARAKSSSASGGSLAEAHRTALAPCW